MRKVFSLAVWLVILYIPGIASAGPPFKTDDPEPVDIDGQNYFNFYVAYQYTFGPRNL